MPAAADNERIDDNAVFKRFSDGGVVVRNERLPWMPWASPGTYCRVLLMDMSHAKTKVLIQVDTGTTLCVHKHLGDAEAYMLDGDFTYEHGSAGAGDYLCEKGRHPQRARHWQQGSAPVRRELRFAARRRRGWQFAGRDRQRVLLQHRPGQRLPSSPGASHNARACGKHRGGPASGRSRCRMNSASSSSSHTTESESRAPSDTTGSRTFPDGSSLVKAAQLGWTPWLSPGTRFKLLDLDRSFNKMTLLIEADAGTALLPYRHTGAGEYYIEAGSFECDRGGLGPVTTCLNREAQPCAKGASLQPPKSMY